MSSTKKTTTTTKNYQAPPLRYLQNPKVWNISILYHDVKSNMYAFYSYFPFHVLKIYIFPQHIRENVTFPVDWVYGNISLFSRQQGIYEDKADQKQSEMGTGPASQVGIKFCIIIPHQKTD